MKLIIKKYCLVLLAMAPIVSVSFAAKAALSVARISGGNASNSELASAPAESSGGVPTDNAA